MVIIMKTLELFKSFSMDCYEFGVRMNYFFSFINRQNKISKIYSANSSLVIKLSSLNNISITASDIPNDRNGIKMFTFWI